jgi:hypothetical protein
VSPQEPEQLGEIHQSLRECPEDTCGSNSPKIETQGFHELSLKGASNPQGMKLMGATLNSAPVTVSVENARLVARSMRGRLLTGTQLIGLELFLEANIKDVVSTFELEVMEVRGLPYPVPVGSNDFSGAYVVEYTDRDGGRRNLCTDTSSGGPDLPWDEAFGQRPNEAVFFEGDRIDTTTMTIDPIVDKSWFNIGCAGHTLAKLHHTRNTTASGAAAYGHQHDDRQATLKMFVADYCGNGKPFTVAGQRLAWRDLQGVMNFYSPPFSLEARWTSNGASCILAPRMLYPSTIEGAERFPDIWQAIADECPALLQKTCIDPDPYSFDGKPRVTGNRSP